MIGKKKGHGRAKPKDRPKTEPPAETARAPTGKGARGETDERKRRSREGSDRGFDPNVNQRPR